MSDIYVDDIQKAADLFRESLEKMGLTNVFIGWHVEDGEGETYSGSAHSEDMEFREQAARLFMISGHVYSNMTAEDD